MSWTAERIGIYDPCTGACGVGSCTRLVPTTSDPRETSEPRIDRIPLARLTTPAPRIKKLFFSPSSNLPNDLFGLVSNRTIPKRLHVAFSPFAAKLTGFQLIYAVQKRLEVISTSSLRADRERGVFHRTTPVGIAGLARDACGAADRRP